MTHKILSRLVLSLRYAGDIRSFCALLFVAFLVPVFRKVNVAYQPRSIIVQIGAFGRKGQIAIRDGSDIAVLCEIFVDGEYAIHLDQEPRVIFDLGSNVGISILYFRLKYPNAHIYAFEPSPSALPQLTQNAALLSGVKVFPMAIGKEDGTVQFYVHPMSSMSSSTVDRFGEGMAQVTVPMLTLQSAMDRAGVTSIDLLKFDIEGAEYSAFIACSLSKLVKACIGEVHLDLAGVSKEEMLTCFDHFEIAVQQINDRRSIISAVQTSQ